MQIADLHIHSKYSRATSRDCDAPHLDFWARNKGISIVGTGDFTHPAWREELKEALSPAEDGFYTLRGDMRLPKLAEMMIKLDGKNADPTDLANYKGVIPNPGATGDNNNTDMENGSQSRLKSKWYLEPVGPSAMNIGYPEQEFILAEAALRGWTDDDPETHYLNGIRAAHEFLGVSSADTRAYLGHEKVQFKGSDTEKLGKIITEKYLNFFMQGGNEAYFELRRTGYPDFSAYLTHNTDQIYNDGYLPLRYRYPQSEIDNNNAQVSEAIKRLDKGDDRNSRMWLLQGSDPLFNPAPFPFRYKN